MIKKNILILVLMLLYQSLYSQEMTWVEPTNLSNLNSSADEFAPCWNNYQETLFFNSTISGFSKFYLAKPDEQFFFETYSLLDGELNQERNNQSYICFENRDIAYISSFRQLPQSSVMNIFQTRRLKNHWTKPFDVDSLKFDIFMGHPTVSPDGSMLIFSTVLNSKFNDTDLWVAYKQENGSWGALMPITNLNTPGNEITPYFASNDTLYFSSNGHEGMGGYDLFFSVRRNGVWQIPNPLTSINTAYDESDFAILPNHRAIFSSNRPGGKGGLDLYLVRIATVRYTDETKQKINFSIATQVPEIKVKEEISFSNISVFNYYFFNIDEFIKSGFQLKNHIFSNVPDSIHLFSPKVISSRIKSLTEHKLIVTLFSPKIDESLKENIYYNLIKSLELPENRISYNFIELNSHQKMFYGENVAFLKFDSNNEKVFSPYDINERKVEIIPPTLELTIESDKNDVLKKIECKILLGNDYKNDILSTTQLPQTFLHKISDYSDFLNNTDSLIIKINATDLFNHIHDFTQSLLVAHSKNLQERFIFYKNKRYLEYFLLIPDINDLVGENPYRFSINSIIEKALNKKNIVIRCFSDNAKSYSTKLKEYIMNQMSSKDIDITIDNDIVKDNNSKKIYSKFLFSILVEI